MIGIEHIASFIPQKRISNYERKEKFEIDDYFIEDKIGVRQVSVKDTNMETSDLCLKAFENLTDKTAINKDDIETLVVVTQNPDVNIPHTSAIVHGELELPEDCACFDISLGCTGYVHGLSIIQSFMKENKLKKGLLFTADPYSKIINPDDKNTALLFGDAAAVSFISDNPVFITGAFTFGTVGKDSKHLTCVDSKLYMSGRDVFNFVVKYVSNDIKTLLKNNELTFHDIDKFIFHQGSKYIVDILSQYLNLDAERVVFDILDYGNTVSSSIPIILEKEMADKENCLMVLSSFGVGLSWSSTIVRRWRN